MDEELRDKVNESVLDCLNTSFNGGLLNPGGRDYRDDCVDEIMALIASYSREARIEEIWKTREAGDLSSTKDTPNSGRVGYFVPNEYIDERIKTLKGGKQNLSEVDDGM